MATTMRDVAQQAGVSIKTVSRVVNGQDEIAPSTRERVLSAIRQLDYRPNTLARGLVSGKTLSAAVIIPQITDPFYPAFVLGVENAASGRGYNVFLGNTNEDPGKELEAIEVLAAKQVDGMILCGTRLSAESLRQVTARHRIAVVTSRPIRGSAVVRIQSGKGLYQITSHLVRLGHEAIGHVGWCTGEDCERADGYRRALQEGGLTVEENRLVFVPRVSVETGQAAAARLLDLAPELTAISCYNDLIAVGVLRACEARGLRVPQDIAVVGFDDISLASLVKPSLTTMRVDRRHVGEIAMQLLFRVIDAGGDHEQIIPVVPEMVIRDSCGAQ